MGGGRGEEGVRQLRGGRGVREGAGKVGGRVELRARVNGGIVSQLREQCLINHKISTTLGFCLQANDYYCCLYTSRFLLVHVYKYIHNCMYHTKS